MAQKYVLKTIEIAFDPHNPREVKLVELLKLRASMVRKESALYGRLPKGLRRLPRVKWRRLLLAEIEAKGVISRKDMISFLTSIEYDKMHHLSNVINELRTAGWIEPAGERGSWAYVAGNNEVDAKDMNEEGTE